jgi:hypothetical protein
MHDEPARPALLIGLACARERAIRSLWGLALRADYA